MVLYIKLTVERLVMDIVDLISQCFTTIILRGGKSNVALSIFYGSHLLSGRVLYSDLSVRKKERKDRHYMIGYGLHVHYFCMFTVKHFIFMNSVHF